MPPPRGGRLRPSRTLSDAMDTLTRRLQASLGEAFTLERELGGGAMSRVFLARERALDRQVVVKTLDLEASSASAERFRREVR